MKKLNILLIIILISVSGSVFSQKATAYVEQKEGIYIVYPGQHPTFEYEYVKSIEAKGINNWRASTVTNKLIKVKTKKEVNGEALIFTEANFGKRM